MARKKKRKVHVFRLLFLVLVAFVLFVFTPFMVYRYFNPLALKASEYHLELGDEFEAMDNVRYVFLGSDKGINLSGLDEIDLGKTGEYKLAYSYNNKEYPFTLVIQDTQAPELIVKDYSTDMAEEIDAQDVIVSVSDGSAFRLSINTENGNSAGTSKVTVTATDENGNSTTQTATLTREVDEEAPEIVGYQESIEVALGAEFNPELTLADNLDPNPSISINEGTLDIYTPGTYKVSYTVTDRSGNTKNYTQNVKVKDTKIVYLTFDDGPSANTKRILDILDQYGVKATFFVTAQNPEYFKYMKEAAEDGHTIAIHTLTHNFADLYSSADAYFADLQAMKDIIKEQTGVEADCIRFPGGSSNTISANYSAGIMSYLVEAVHQAGYEYFDWNVDSQDASGNNVAVDTIYAGATTGIGEPFAVILFHDTDAKDTTVEALPAIIEAYQAAGYEFEGLTKSSFGAHHGVNN